MLDVGRTALPSRTVVQHTYVSNFHMMEGLIREGWQVYTIRALDGGGMEIDLYKEVECSA